MKRVLTGALCAATVAMLGAALPAHAQSADTLSKISSSGKMTFAYRESSVPFSYLEGPEKPIGFAVDISNAIADAVRKQTGKSNLTVGWQAVTSANRIPLLQNGTIDLECGSTTNMQVVRRYNEEKGLGINIVSTKDHADAALLVEADRAAAFAMDDILLFGLKANAKDPASLEVVGDSLQVEPYACMIRKNDPKFKALVDGVITGMMKSGEFEKLYNKWFMQPIPPRNQSIGLPMSKELQDNIKAPSDKPAT